MEEEKSHKGLSSFSVRADLIGQQTENLEKEWGRGVARCLLIRQK